MDLRTLSHRLDALAGRLPPAPTRPMAIITVSRFDPDNPPEPLPVEVAFRTDKYGVRHPFPMDDGIDTATHWHYRDEASLAALTKRFEHEYGDHTLSPGEPPNLLVHLVDADAIAALNPTNTRGHDQMDDEEETQALFAALRPRIRRDRPDLLRRAVAALKGRFKPDGIAAGVEGWLTTLEARFFQPLSPQAAQFFEGLRRPF